MQCYSVERKKKDKESAGSKPVEKDECIPVSSDSAMRQIVGDSQKRNFSKTERQGQDCKRVNHYNC